MSIRFKFRLSKNHLLFCLVILFIFSLFYVNVSRSKKWQKRDDLKYILFWNSFYIYPYFGLGDHDGQDTLLGANCSFNKCYLTETRTLMPIEEYDALIFHFPDFEQTSFIRFWEELIPSVRSPNQRYVFFIFEPPVDTGGDLTQWKYFFNWTWTYRLDSDIPSPYARVLPIKSTNFFPVLPPQTWMTPDDRVVGYSGVMKKKVRKIAWLVSHCDTHGKRELYVERLSKYITVDKFGGCGSTLWPKNDLTGFYEMISEKYKFYLSFENSLCKEYVTEKFFNILKYNVVPIVYGGADYNSFAPPMSYIDALDYESPEELVKYISYLDQSPEEYVKYFWWKKYYSVSTVNVPQVQSLCKLCELLHSDQPRKSYADMHKWWTMLEGEAVCRDPPQLEN